MEHPSLNGHVRPPLGQDPRRQFVSEADADMLELNSYLLSIKSHTCRNCQKHHSWSELQEVWTHPTKTVSSALRVLRFTQSIQKGYEVAYINHAPMETPVCHECVTTFASEGTRTSSAIDATAWAQTLRRKAQEQQADKRAAANPSPRRAPTLGEL
jgi:protein-arginine kinase activator protein McsA